MDYTVIIQLSSYAIAIIGGGYGIMMRRKLVRMQLRSEQARTSYYRAKRKAEDMRKNQHLVQAGKTIWDLITGNKTSSTTSV